jgi:hypothetical protein
MKFEIMPLVRRQRSVSRACSSSGTYFWSAAIWICARTSPQEPLAMNRNWMNSVVVQRSNPSAIFDMTDTAARRI